MATTVTTEATFSLREVDAYLFDAFGTTVDWYTTVSREVQRRSKGKLKELDAADFAREWRQGYYEHIRKINQGGEGTLNTDTMHREILENMLASSSKWSHLAPLWDEDDRKKLTMIWHNLDTYEDTIPGLTELKKHGLVVTLSNGNYRLLLDMAKNKGLPWDGILSTELFGTYKPGKQAYLSAAYHIAVPPERIAMVAAHKSDLNGAAQAGLKTVYVPRPAEDTKEIRENTRSKAEGGEVDLVVKDFMELVKLAAEARKGEQ